MTILGKKQMSEEDIKLNYITPVILKGWKGHITMETKITDGRINIRGNIVARSKPKFADYMLYLNDGKPIAVVEAKDNNHSVSHGLQQAMTYAQMMDLPFAYIGQELTSAIQAGAPLLNIGIGYFDYRNKISPAKADGGFSYIIKANRDGIIHI